MRRGLAFATKGVAVAAGYEMDMVAEVCDEDEEDEDDEDFELPPLPHRSLPDKQYDVGMMMIRSSIDATAPATTMILDRDHLEVMALRREDSS